jgi:hypothetical protein
MTSDALKKGLQNLFNVERPWINVEKMIKLYLQRFFTYMSTLPFFFLNKHTLNTLSHILYFKKNSNELYKNNFSTLTNNILLYV